ncbi:MAG TPA: RsmE family RNA methyltransferase [Candidatus Dormibacteraeota bacterium]|nr:RsmE family RNA methyltransferase [Candidatus Dormibacteraeota bacterium]
MPYFFASRSGNQVEITGQDARHLALSLRARPGERISVVEPAGRLLTVRLDAVSATRISGFVEADVEHHPEPELSITVAVAMLPSASLELVLSRCTEAGAARFILVDAARSISRASKPGRWATICREAAMLAGRLVVPEVVGPLPFQAAWEQADEPWLLDRSGRGLGPFVDDATLFIGPEGGWSPEELNLGGDRLLSLGERNLRADTAALVALALALGPSQLHTR